VKVFFCACGNLVHFENVSCVACGRALAFVPERREMVVVDPAAQERLCSNGRAYGACNWLVAEGDDHPFCVSCRLNQIVPPLADDAARAGWIEIERAKRRLVYSLLDIGLPLVSKADDPEQGLAFAFLQQESPQQPIVTGHADGVITLDVAEADDPFREEVRRSLGETYRTLLGHLRHEVAHYYWDRFFDGDANARGRFRDLFGDETADYEEALRAHYSSGPPADWQDRFVSAYASSHPWEDWAETFAHYLHMRDTTETAHAFGLTVAARDPSGRPVREASARPTDIRSFDGLVRAFPPLTLAINALNRSMGVRDAYPFVLSGPAVTKMRFVHDTAIGAARKHSTNHQGGRK
jgi:hypothetical protein